MSPTVIAYFIVIAISMVFSAFFSASDMAFSVVNLRLLREKAATGSWAAKTALRYAVNYEKTIVTILFGNNLVNILASTLAASLIFHEPFSSNPSMWSFIITIAMLIIVLIFGEILPKNVARIHSYGFCLFAVYLLRFCEIAFWIIVTPVTWLGRKITDPLLRRVPEQGAASEEELQAMVDDIEEEGIIDEDQSELLSNSIEFADTRAYEVMTPRVKVEGIEMNEDPSRRLFQGEGFHHSRIVVYEKDMDHIIGYLPLKSLQKAVLNGKKLSLKELMLPIVEVPRTMEVSTILATMKKSRHHIVVVKDEYGGTEGVVTLEDILEELVGEMWDESEMARPNIKKGEKANRYIVQGDMNIVDFFDEFEMDEDAIEEDYDTVSGWINNQLGTFAKEGDKFEYKKLTVKVTKADAYTVIEAEVTYHPRRKEEE